jgi:6-phosphogluconolactonase
MISGADDAAIAKWGADRLIPNAGRETETIAVPGGSTPFPIFEHLAQSDLDFTRFAIYPTDDRVVPSNHPASNTGKIAAIFEPTGAYIGDLTQAALAQSRFAEVKFDLVWLGMGADGHIASLFPNTDPQVDDPNAIRRITPDPLPPEAPFDRVTLTIPTLLRTPHLMFVIRGEEKRAVFEAAMRGDHDLPVARLLRAAENQSGLTVTCFT